MGAGFGTKCSSAARISWAGTVFPSSAALALFGDPGAAAGRSLAAGDSDGDGLAELLVGAPYGDVPDTDAGSAYLLRAATLGW